MSVKRYSLHLNIPGSVELNESLHGSLVKYHDYTALEQKLTESQREFRAADATIENLQMQVETLAAENAGLKESRKNLAEFIHEELNAGYPLNMSIETPNTDAFLAEVRAQGVEMFANHIFKVTGKLDLDDQKGSDFCRDEAEDFAENLRKGVQS